MNSIVYNIDCNEGMKKYPDKHFDLAVVDPPFGIGKNWKKDRKGSFYTHNNDFNKNIPDLFYFSELLRVSKNQIIFGYNYFSKILPPTNHLIFWDKKKDAIKQFGSAGELAWTSFTKYPLLKITLAWNGFCRCEKTKKIHPHQKPIMLYSEIYHIFLKDGGRVLDTHLGSGSNRIAADMRKNIEFTGFELDKNYFEEQNRWFNTYKHNNYESIH